MFLKLVVLKFCHLGTYLLNITFLIPSQFLLYVANNNIDYLGDLHYILLEH